MPLWKCRESRAKLKVDTPFGHLLESAVLLKILLCAHLQNRRVFLLVFPFGKFEAGVTTNEYQIGLP